MFDRKVVAVRIVRSASTVHPYDVYVGTRGFLGELFGATRWVRVAFSSTEKEARDKALRYLNAGSVVEDITKPEDVQ